MSTRTTRVCTIHLGFVMFTVVVGAGTGGLALGGGGAGSGFGGFDPLLGWSGLGIFLSPPSGYYLVTTVSTSRPSTSTVSPSRSRVTIPRAS